MPGRCSCSYSPENGRSVAFSRSTAYCIGVNSLRHSASLFATLPGIVLASDMGASFHKLRTCFLAENTSYLPKTLGSKALVNDARGAHQRRLLDIVLREDLLQVL